jgi:hypothetical protein
LVEQLSLAYRLVRLSVESNSLAEAVPGDKETLRLANQFYSSLLKSSLFDEPEWVAVRSAIAAEASAAEAEPALALRGALEEVEPVIARAFGARARLKLMSSLGAHMVLPCTGSDVDVGVLVDGFNAARAQTLELASAALGPAGFERGAWVNEPATHGYISFCKSYCEGRVKVELKLRDAAGSGDVEKMHDWIDREMDEEARVRALYIKRCAYLAGSRSYEAFKVLFYNSAMFQSGGSTLLVGPRARRHVCQDCAGAPATECPWVARRPTESPAATAL